MASKEILLDTAVLKVAFLPVDLGSIFVHGITTKIGRKLLFTPIEELGTRLCINVGEIEVDREFAHAKGASKYFGENET